MGPIQGRISTYCSMCFNNFYASQVGLYMQCSPMALLKQAKLAILLRECNTSRFFYPHHTNVSFIHWMSCKRRVIGEWLLFSYISIAFINRSLAKEYMLSIYNLYNNTYRRHENVHTNQYASIYYLTVLVIYV